MGLLILLLTACTTQRKAVAVPPDTPVARVEKVLSAEEQKALTPEMVLESLKAGNDRFLKNDFTARDHSKLVRDASVGQFPKAVIISCLDSRVTVEDAFDKGIGDLFIGRVAGNFVNTDLLGSIEYGCKVAGAKLVVVMGHQECGAIKSAIDNVQLGNITAMLENIKPAVEKSQDFTGGEKTSKNKEFLKYVTMNNVLLNVEKIRTQSPILREMEQKGEIRILGAIYDIHTGKVTFL
jgi:carbonic anhydrase